MLPTDSMRASPAKPEGDRRIRMTLTAPEALSEVIEETARSMGVTNAEAIVRAVALLRAAQDAKRAGRAVGSVEDADVLETEFTGF